MIKGETTTGFKYEIPKDVLDDYELVEAVGEIDVSASAIPRVLTLLLGEEQKNKLKDHIRNEAGRVPMSAMNKEIMDILSNQTQVKK